MEEVSSFDIIFLSESIGGWSYNNRGFPSESIGGKEKIRWGLDRKPAGGFP
ncbi:TPA: hypothetical protein H1005_02135 [archaeon]|nr:hypothetical protein [Candidatus Naiadarchaeales archaeon SRR2090153.bin1042]